MVLAGGDGTMNAAAPALLETGLPFAIIPLGTGNDLARTLGIPEDLAAAIDMLAPAPDFLDHDPYTAAALAVRRTFPTSAVDDVVGRLTLAEVECALRTLAELWDGDDPEAAELAPKVRKLVDDGVLSPAAGQLTAAVYGLGTVVHRAISAS